MDPALEGGESNPQKRRSPSTERAANGGYHMGDKVLAQTLVGDDWEEAEVVAHKPTDDTALYYIHYTGHDRRLDRWLPEHALRPLPEAGNAVGAKRPRKATELSREVFDPKTLAMERANVEEEKRWVESTKVKTSRAFSTHTG